MHFFCILEKRQVIKMMFKYELKKIFSKRVNQVLLAAVLVVTIIYSGMAIGSMGMLYRGRKPCKRIRKKISYFQ